MILTIQSFLSMNPYIHFTKMPKVRHHLQNPSDVSFPDYEHQKLFEQIHRTSTPCHRQLPSLPYHYHHQRSTPSPSPPTLMITNSGDMIDNLCDVTSSITLMKERPSIAIDSQDLNPYSNDNENCYRFYEQKPDHTHFRQRASFNSDCLMIQPLDQRNISLNESDESFVIPRRHSSAMTTVVSKTPFCISNNIHCTRDLSPRSKSNNNNNNNQCLSLNDDINLRRPSMPTTFHFLPVNNERRRQSQQHTNNLTTTVTTATLSTPCSSPLRRENHAQSLMSHKRQSSPSSETILKGNETFNQESMNVEQMTIERQQIDEQDIDEIDQNDCNRPVTSISVDRNHDLLQIPSIHHESVDPNESSDQLSEYWPDETWYLQGHHHLPVRRHRSLPATSFTSAPLYGISARANQQRSSSFRVRSNNRLVHQEPNGRWRIKVKKSRPFLGIAIEGGSNVSTQSQPRIINIQAVPQRKTYMLVILS
ncbi:uncharacterized protein LOC113791098 isoform X2 [Dermatophagoides pteronyssinus]|uniref:uncharacterized protein LOC113791098 isoform X2 n=1 Tax=Dermatophagoides pteronyssinus TaxID=6956 RepID=UPI003F67ED0B